jgi:lysozyme
MNDINPRGVDLSHFNADPDFHAMSHSGIAFVFLKATQGLGFVDATYTDRRQRAREVGLRVGSYHFFDPCSSGEDQARHFLSVVGCLAPNELPPALDLEAAIGWDSISVEQRIEQVGAWLSTVENALGVRPIVYTSIGWWQGVFGEADFSGHPLWLAHYAGSSGDTAHWKSWTVWQNAQFGTVVGAGVGCIDTDQWNGPLPAPRSGS